MSLLDDLRKQAEERRRRQAREQGTADAGQTHRLEVLRPWMVRIHGWLETFVETLELLDEPRPARFEIPGMGPVEGLEQAHYAFQQGEARGELPPPLHLMFTLSGPGNPSFVLDNPVAAEKQVEELRAAGLHLQGVRRRRNEAGREQLQVTLRAEIPVRFTFRVPEHLQYIELLERNFEQPGTRTHVIRPERLNEQLLDDFGRYVLREQGFFLRDQVPLEVRQKLRERLERERREKERAEGSGSRRLGKGLRARMRGLFQRQPTLCFEYHGEEHCLHPEDTPWTVGRSPDSGLQVVAPHVSRRHFTIHYRDGHFVLEDQSRNGTYIRPYDGRELLIRHDAVGLSGKGFLCPGAPASEDQEHLVHYRIEP